MASYSDYFKRVSYQARWRIGDRVQGRYQGRPFVGTVYNDSLVSEDLGPKVSVALDLPLIIEGRAVNIIWVTPWDLSSR